MISRLRQIGSDYADSFFGLSSISIAYKELITESSMCSWYNRNLLNLSYHTTFMNIDSHFLSQNNTHMHNAIACVECGSENTTKKFTSSFTHTYKISGARTPYNNRNFVWRHLLDDWYQISSHKIKITSTLTHKRKKAREFLLQRF